MPAAEIGFELNMSQHPFEKLTPAFVMDAIESLGYLCDYRVFALNSYENRVYQVGLEDGAPLVAKFYRPERWSNAAIREEHQFCFELVDHELPLVAPLRGADGGSLFEYQGFRFALYPRQGGHAPEFDNLDNLLIMGRLLGRLHRVGALRPFAHRPVLDCKSFGRDSVALISAKFIPPEHQGNYDALTRDLLDSSEAIMAEVSPAWIRTHGDCHAGNILWRHEIPNLVDLDDARMAPAVQDLWMMLSGDRPRQTVQLAEILEGYDEFFPFRAGELRLIEVLRSLRILNYSAWLARRWDDPAFPHYFPWFNTPRYWDEHILQLREQIAALNEPVLPLQ